MPNIRKIKTKHESLILSAEKLIKDNADMHNCSPFYVAAFAYPVDFHKILLEAAKKYKTKEKMIKKAIRIVEEIRFWLNNFSNKILKNFIKKVGVANMVNNYLINNPSTSYPEIFQNILKLSEKTLNSSGEEVQGVSTESKVYSLLL